MRWMPALVMAAWIASLYTLELITDDGDVQVYLFVAFTLAAGVLANRWWVLLVPFVAVAGLFTWDPTNPCEECREELEWLGQLFLGLLLAAAAAIVLALAVAIRRGIAWVGRRRYASRARNAR
jgi:hypothetical protein